MYTKELKTGALKYIRQKTELEGERNSDTIAVAARYTLQAHMEHFLG